LLIGAGWTGLAAFDIWFLLIRPDTGWDIILIAPLAWLAYVFVSVPLDAVVTSGSDMEFAMTASGESSSVRIKELVEDNLVTLRNLLVAVPSLVSSLILGAPSLI
jgi:hypothetical protein